ncbi:hypothetical protein M408DRAFT_12548 [Serendipita vermifera MAFF 305830]|uniref:Uncharacterized protein n=1 Tax=Serendipita vermifera MAFF 305830 TaxID=933852 RepID=A0A0C3AA01_SERVB|nr:hypothetical protein M408DRAFT_12548 [Serendipita vermifera MAFF 305830]
MPKFRYLVTLENDAVGQSIPIPDGKSLDSLSAELEDRGIKNFTITILDHPVTPASAPSPACSELYNAVVNLLPKPLNTAMKHMGRDQKAVIDHILGTYGYTPHTPHSRLVQIGKRLVGPNGSICLIVPTTKRKGVRSITCRLNHDCGKTFEGKKLHQKFAGHLRKFYLDQARA